MNVVSGQSEGANTGFLNRNTEQENPHSIGEMVIPEQRVARRVRIGVRTGLRIVVVDVADLGQWQPTPAVLTTV